MDDVMGAMPSIECSFNCETKPYGSVVLIIHNCPITETENGFVPAMKLSPEVAMEIGMNLIYVAKTAQAFMNENGG